MRNLDPALAAALVAGLQVFLVAGVGKGALLWRRLPRRCPSCGRLGRSCSCRRRTWRPR
jgi:hypothetical protein